MRGAADVDPSVVTAAHAKPRARLPLIDTALSIIGLLVVWQTASLFLGQEVLTPPLATTAKLLATAASAVLLAIDRRLHRGALPG
jgi:hypothetical protein